jgi:hypothetical protein
MIRDTAGNIVTAAAAELGLPPPTFGNPLGDPTGTQMYALLNALGVELWHVHDWQQLLKTMAFTGDGVTVAFPTPTDFARQVNQTQWDQSNRRPLQGPDNPQIWGWNQYGIVSVGVYYRYRIAGGKYEVFPVPAPAQQFALYYISKDWVEDGSNAGTFKDKITAAVDIPLYPARLLIAGLKMKFWAQKGFDTTTIGREYQGLLDAEKAQSGGAAVLNLSSGDEHFLINQYNVPEGNSYGM